MKDIVKLNKMVNIWSKVGKINKEKNKEETIEKQPSQN